MVFILEKRLEVGALVDGLNNGKGIQLCFMHLIYRRVHYEIDGLK